MASVIDRRAGGGAGSDACPQGRCSISSTGSAATSRTLINFSNRSMNISDGFRAVRSMYKKLYCSSVAAFRICSSVFFGKMPSISITKLSTSRPLVSLNRIRADWLQRRMG